MANGFLDRVANLIRGAALSFVKDIEKARPEAVIQAAIDAQTDRVQRASKSIARLRRYCKELEREQASILQEIASLETEATHLAGRDDDRALTLLERKHAGLDRIAEIKATIADTEARIEASIQEKETAIRDLETLKLEKQRLLAEAAAHRVERDRAALDAGFPSNAADVALANLRERFGTDADPVAKREAARKSRLQKAMEELQAIKGGRRASPDRTPPQDNRPPLHPPGGASTGKDEAPRDPDPDLPNRTL